MFHMRNVKSGNWNTLGYNNMHIWKIEFTVKKIEYNF